MEDDVGEELRFHVESKIQELTARGIQPEEARRQALRHFGDLGEVSAICERIGREHSRRIAWNDRLGEWWTDTHRAARSLYRAPGFSCVVIGTLAAGLGGAASLFSLVDAWIIQAVRLPEPSRLIYARSLDVKRGRETGVSMGDYLDLASRATSIQNLAAWSNDSFTLALERDSERIQGVKVSPNFFQTVRAQPELGRTFLPNEDERGRHLVAVVSHGFWKARLNSQKSAIGSTLKLNGEPHVVIGVMPAKFHFTVTGRANIWTPLAPSAEDRTGRQDHYLQMVGRLRPGATVSSARHELSGIAAALAVEYPATNRDVGAVLISLNEETGRHTGRDVVLVTFAVTLGLLLIACSNVANLLLVRALSQQRLAAIQKSGLPSQLW